MRLTVQTCSTNNTIRAGEIVALKSENPEGSNPESIEVKGIRSLRIHEPKFCFGEGYQKGKPSGFITISGYAYGPNKETFPVSMCLY